MLMNTLMPLAVVLAGVTAASSSNSCSFDDVTMTAAASVSQLASCPTLEGTLEITGNDLGSLSFNSVEEISGDIRIFNSSSITDVGFTQLSKISGSLEIDALTQLHVIDFSKLGEISDLSLISLPSLSTINLNTGVSKLNNLQISDTALSSLQGLITNVNTLGELDVNNNKNITSIDLGNLQTVKENLILSFNGDSCEINLDSLIWSSNLTIQDAGSISASELSAVNGSLIFGYNKFEKFELPVNKIGGALQIFANDDMTEFSLDNLTAVGGELRIFNNTELDNMAFQSLETVKGAVNINGSFSNFTMPELEEVDGDFTVQSDNDDFSCKSFKKLKSDNKIEGHNFKCIAPAKNTSKSGSASSGSLETETFEGSSSSGSSESDDDDDNSTSSSSKDSSASTLIGSGLVAIILTTVFSALI